jgi:hypothetical protein
MAFIVKALGAGTRTVTGSADLYTVPDGKSAMVTSVRLANGSATIIPTVNVYVKPSGAAPARRVAKKDHSLAVGSALVLEEVLTLGQGDKVQLNLSGGLGPPEVGYMINGVERE